MISVFPSDCNKKFPMIVRNQKNVTTKKGYLMNFMRVIRPKNEEKNNYILPHKGVRKTYLFGYWIMILGHSSTLKIMQ